MLALMLVQFFIILTSQRVDTMLLLHGTVVGCKRSCNQPDIPHASMYPLRCLSMVLELSFN
jgi:hypothetical protein